MENSFELVSERLKEAVRIAGEMDIPVLISWLARGVDWSELENGSFDEEALLNSLGEMLQDTNSFVFEPEIIAKLRKYYDGLLAKKKEYLRFALQSQKTRLEKMLTNPVFLNMDKQRNDINRHLQRTSLELSKLDSEKEIERIYDSINLRINTLLKKKYGKNPSGVDLGPVRMVWLSQSDQENMSKIEQDALGQHNKKLNECREKVADFTKKLDLLEIRVKTRSRLIEVLESTESRLGQIQIEDNPIAREEIVNEVSDSLDADLTPTLSDEEMLSPFPLPIDDCILDPFEDFGHQYEIGEDVPQESGKVTLLDDQKDSSKVFEEVIKPDEIKDVVRLRELIKLAQDTKSKIRVLCSDIRSHVYERGWTEVLNALGFEGLIEFGSYEMLDRTKDLDSPVIVPKKMNTHQSFWNRKAFANLIVTDISSTNQLLVHINGGKKKAS